MKTKALHVWKTEGGYWQVRLDKFDPAVAEQTIRTALVARDLADPDEDVQVSYLGEEGSLHVFRAIRLYRPRSAVRARREIRIGDRLRIIREGSWPEGSSHCYAVDTIVTVRGFHEFSPWIPGTVFVDGPDRWSRTVHNYIFPTEYELVSD